jgi:hypothetical protein
MTDVQPNKQPVPKKKHGVDRVKPNAGTQSADREQLDESEQQGVNRASDGQSPPGAATKEAAHETLDRQPKRESQQAAERASERQSSDVNRQAAQSDDASSAEQAGQNPSADPKSGQIRP